MSLMSSVTIFKKASKETAPASTDPDLRSLLADVERLSRVQRSRAEACKDACEHLAGALTSYLDGATALQRAVDAVLVERKRLAGSAGIRMRTAVDVPEYAPLFQPDVIATLLAQDLAVHSSGRWPTRSALDIYTLSQGPRFHQRVTQYLLMLTRQVSQDPTDQPPEAA